MTTANPTTPGASLPFAPTRPAFISSCIAGFAFRVPRLVLLSLSLSLALPAVAAQPELPPLVERALETMESSEQEGYAYTMKMSEPGKSSIAHFDPAKPTGRTWDLLQKDGKTPTAKEVEIFRKERAEREKKRAEQGKEEKKKKSRGGDKELRALIAPGSVQLLSETAERASYRFRMQSDDEAEQAMVESIRGTLVVSKAGPHVESLDLASTGEMKPITGVKISEFHLKLTFFPPDGHGRALPATIQSKIKGRAMLVKKIDQAMSVTFSDYAKRPLPGAPTAPAR